ncbi:MULTISPECIES: S1/P1 nuclease [Bradyrhizobium]|uniref:S1/P1 nuclease n=1 Tax=Bradyrhizobium TaxID=374 RepID=UPI0013EE9D63
MCRSRRPGPGAGRPCNCREIARRRLDPATLGKIEGLLAQEAPALDHPNVTLASIASWADEYRADHKDTAGWHFVDTG